MSLYSPSEQTANALNGSGNMTDAIGTINPAALNSGGELAHTIAPSLLPLAPNLQTSQPSHPYPYLVALG